MAAVQYTCTHKRYTEQHNKQLGRLSGIRTQSALVLIEIYLLTAILLTPGGSSTVHIYTQTVHRTTQLTTWKALWDSNPECSCIDRDIFVNCNWVDPRWQQYSTQLHTNSTQNNTINNLEGFVGFEPRVLLH